MQRAVGCASNSLTSADLAVSDEGKLVYTRLPRSGSGPKATGTIEILDLDAKKKDERVKKVAAGIDAFRATLATCRVSERMKRR